MKKMLFICLVLFIFISIGCYQETEASEGAEVFVKEYYSMNDFKTIKAGESTYQDVYEIAPSICRGLY